MKFEFFQSMTRDEAREYLEAYLTCEREGLSRMEVEAAREGISFDFSMESVPLVLTWILKRVRLVPGVVDDKLPAWIRQTMEPEKVVEFDEDSKLLVMRASYYLGEAFVRHSPCLSWDTGNPEFIECNMPVIRGFRNGIEMGPIMITENMFLSVLRDGASTESIQEAVAGWCSLIPKEKKRKSAVVS
jgi:hypothetical protein